MSWHLLSYKIKTVLDGLGFVQAPEMFTVAKLPTSLDNRVYCIRSEGMVPNPAWREVNDRFFPQEMLQVDAIYSLEANTQQAYDVAMELNHQLVASVADPDNRSGTSRIVHFVSTRVVMFESTGFWLVVENNFFVELITLHTPVVSTGTEPAYVIAPSPAFGALYDGMVVIFQAHATNTGNVTLTVNGLAPKTVKEQTAQLSVGDIVENHLVCCVYDGTQFQFKRR